MLLNINDPIQVHLLVETALWDAKEYEILSSEEVDQLKKQCQSLNQRIQTARQNLIVQSKYRDATRSVSKLYPDRKKGAELNDNTKSKRGLFGGRRNSDQIREADLERATCEKKCEDLAIELWSLERRLMEPENRLLKHTAGILQMTHRGPKRDQKSPEEVQQNGIPPGSPESMYTYHNDRNSIDEIDDEEPNFDERSFYRPVDPLDISFGAFGMHQELETPSTEVSKEHLQLISSTEQKLEDLNSALREVIIKANPKRDASYSPVPLARTNAQGRPTVPGETLQSHLDYLEQGIATLDQEHSAAKRQADELNASMEDTLEELNREVMGLLSPTHPELQEPPALTGQQTGLRDQLYYFQDIIASVEEELSKAAEIIANPPVSSEKSEQKEQNEQMETVLTGLWEIIQSGEEEIRRQKQERRQQRAASGRVVDDSDTGSEMGDPNEPFTLQAFSAKVQFLYSTATQLKEHKKVLQRQIKQQRELNNKSESTKDAELLARQEELEQTRDLLEKTERSANELQEQLSTVMGQLAKARQAEKMDSESRANTESTALREIQEQLTNSRRVHEEELTNANREAAERIASLSDANRKVEEQLVATTRDSQERIANLATNNRNLENQLEAANKKISELEAELQEMKDGHGINNAEYTGKMTDHEARIAELSTALAAAATTRVAYEASIREKDKLLQSKEKEVEEISMKIAELQTEVVIARAELDGAYGSRAQRAAEVASNPLIQREIDALTNKNITLQEQIDALHSKNFTLQGEIATLQAVRQGPSPASAEQEAKVKELKRELEETIEEYELMTKASIEWEREREKLEGEIDKLRDEREGLETQLSDEKVRWMGLKSPGGDGTPASAGVSQNTSTTVLKNEFKKMMRDTRAENARALRVRFLLLLLLVMGQMLLSRAKLTYE
jgi:predicted  nucleic acid-binding Zn-ribbon protein